MNYEILAEIVGYSCIGLAAFLILKPLISRGRAPTPHRVKATLPIVAFGLAVLFRVEIARSLELLS